MKSAMETPNARHRHRRCQFGLRKLLLWTAVVAFLLGVAASLGDGAWLVAGCILLISVLRVAFGSRVAGILSVAVAVMLWVSLWWAATTAARPGPSLAEATLAGLAFVVLFPLATFGIAEGLVSVVNWADKMLETKSDGETRRD